MGGALHIISDTLLFEQLEAAGLWHWAVYVMLHSGAPETAILDLVARHIVPPNQDGTHFRFLTARLGIPERMLYQALVLHPPYCWTRSGEVVAAPRQFALTLGYSRPGGLDT